MQAAPLTISSNPKAMTIHTVPQITHGIVLEESPVEEKTAVEPPPYSEPGKSPTPESVRGYGKDGNHEPVALEQLQKDPAYVVVLSPHRNCR